MHAEDINTEVIINVAQEISCFTTSLSNMRSKRCRREGRPVGKRPRMFSLLQVEENSWLKESRLDQ